MRFASDSLLEGDGFEISVPGRETVKPSWEADCSRSGSGSVGEPKVRIRFPPAESQQRTVRVPGSELLAAAPSCLGIALRAEGGSVAARCRVGGVQNACGAPRKAKPRLLWAPWQLEGEALVEAEHDATLLALKDHSRPRPGAPERGGLT